MVAASYIRFGLLAGGVLAAVAVGTALVTTRVNSIAGSAPPAPHAAPVASAAPASPPPSFDVVRVAPSGSAVLAGRSAPKATVTVLDNGRELGQVHADDRGEWVFLPPGPIQPGPRQLTLLARDDAGRETRSDADVVLLVPDRPALPPTPAFAVAAPPAPLAIPDTPRPARNEPAQAASAQPEPVLAVVAPPAGPMRILGPGKGAATRLTLDVVDYDSAGQIRFAGGGPAASSVRIYVDNAAVGDARTDKDGHWTLEPSAPVKPGVHDVRVDQVGARGRVLSRVEMPFQRADLPSLEPGRVVVQPGQNLWRIARQAYGTGVRYTVIYRANQDQIRDPDRIYPGQVFDVPASTAAK